MAHNLEGDLLVAGGLAPYAYQTRQGNTWSVATATAFAAVVTKPLTVAPLEIVNNSGTQYMVINHIWSWMLLGTAVTWAHTIWAQVGAAVYSANTALVFYDGMGGSYASATASKARTALTQTVVENGWQAFPGSTMPQSLGAATPSGACVGQVEGKLVVPPGLAVHLAVSASVTTASAFQCGANFTWTT